MVREKLKIIDLKLFEFAKELKITRPTLNTYIELFDSGEKIPKSKYQFIFEKLFDDGINNKDDFLEELNRIHSLLERDEYIGALELDVKSTDLMTSVIDNIREDLTKVGYNEHVFKFVNMLITSYRKEKVFVDFVNYFLYLNGIMDYKDINEEEKPFVSHCFKLMSLDKCDELEIDTKFYNKFIERIERIRAEKESKSNENAKNALNRRIKEEINKKVKKQLALGVDVDEIDYDEIIKNIDFSQE